MEISPDQFNNLASIVNALGKDVAVLQTQMGELMWWARGILATGMAYIFTKILRSALNGKKAK